MESLTEKTIYCPYCGEGIDVLIDHQEAGHEYTEDCQVCCRPIIFRVSTDFSGEMFVSVHDENDT